MLNSPKPTVIWLTGLSGSGKTTIANDLGQKLRNKSIEPVILDGDEIRQATRQFAFDEASRKKHNLYVGSMAAVLEEQGKTVIVALVSPYEDTRNEIRTMCKNFVEVFLATDIKVCIERDPKGLYKKALAGEILDFTGISAPYFPPKDPEIRIDTATLSVDECSEKIMDFLKI